MRGNEFLGLGTMVGLMVLPIIVKPAVRFVERDYVGVFRDSMEYNVKDFVTPVAVASVYQDQVAAENHQTILNCYSLAIYQVLYESDYPVEYWKFPTETLADGRGDCEDGANLLCSLLRNKLEGAWTAVGLFFYQGHSYSHAWVVVDFEGRWLLEPSLDMLPDPPWTSEEELKDSYLPLIYFNDQRIRARDDVPANFYFLGEATGKKEALEDFWRRIT